MPRVPITVMGWKCERCGHEWIPRQDGEHEPEVCPGCKSPYWNKPRRHQAPMLTYAAFRDAVRGTLKGATEPLTWTEIRTIAKLPEKFPNNQWVRRMEGEIGLTRTKDGHGIIKWSLGRRAID